MVTYDIYEYSRTVKIDLETGKTGLIYATSPQLKELLVVGRDFSEVSISILGAIRDLYEARGIKVEVR